MRVGAGECVKDDMEELGLPPEWVSVQGYMERLHIEKNV